MPRTVFSAVVVTLAASATLMLSACADDSANHKHPPQDPPDYHGVPTDMTPPSMIDAPSAPKAASQPK
jgi:hypothetical protein